MSTTTTTGVSRRLTASSQVIVAGLVVGALLGQVGGALGVGAAQTFLFAVSSVGLTVGAILLALRHLERHEPLVAGGFAILAVAEMILWSGGGPEQGGEVSFAVATLYYVPALIMISLPAGLPRWARTFGVLAVFPFGLHAVLFLLGREPTSQGPPAIIGYVLLTLAVIGWIVSVIRPAGR